MNDINHTLNLLRTLLSLPELDLNEDGQVEIDLAEGLTTHLTKIDDHTLECSFRLPELDIASPGMMAAMLAANFLGAATGAGRLAIDPTKHEAIYCERWQVDELTAESLEARLLSFATGGTFWLTTGSDSLVKEAEQDAQPFVDQHEVATNTPGIRI